MITFLVIWVGQVISSLGSNLSGFALGVWVYQRTGSATRFALIALVTTLPGILMSPLAGALVDRWDRRRAMILGRGDPTVFLTRPISLTLLIVTALVLAVMMLPRVRRKRDEVFVEGD